MKMPEIKKPSLDKEALRGSFTSKAFRVGGYSAVSCLIVVAIAVVVVLMVNALPATITKLDTTSNQLFTISEQTRQIAEGLQEDVTLYHIVQSGAEDNTISRLLERYAALGSHIKVVKKDPVVNPTFAGQYTDEQITNNSVIVVCGERSQYVSYYDIYVTDYSNYYYTGTYDTSFNGESALTSAIDYVTNDNLPKIYYLSGHGETELSSSLSSAVQKENMDLESLSLLTMEAVPEDCAVLLINAPTSDLSAAETEMLLDYLDQGGHLLVFTNLPKDGSLDNLASIMAAFGMHAQDGIVVEGDASYCIRNYLYYLLPEMSSHEITNPLVEGGYYMLMPMAHGLVLDEELPEGVTVNTLAMTSASAYLKSAGYEATTLEKESGDAEGPFALAAAASKGDGRLVWYTSGQMLTDSANEIVSGSNHDLFLNSLGWMCERTNSISIHAKSLARTTLTLTNAQVSRWSLILVAILPLACVVAGITTWIKRKRQ